MSVDSPDKTMGCAEVRPLLAKLWRRELEAAEAERVRKHLQGCEECEEALSTHIAASVLRQETPMPQHLADLQPPPKALRGFIASHQQRMQMLLAESPASDQQPEPWTQDEMEALRWAWLDAVNWWSSPPSRVAGAFGGRAPAVGHEEEWPPQIDVPVASSSGQQQGRTVRFVVVEPPTLTSAGEFVASVRTDVAGFMGWSLQCTVTFAAARKATFAGTVQQAADAQGWLVRLHTTGLPAHGTPAAQLLAGDVVIPFRFVEWSLQEKSSQQGETIPGRAVLVGISHYVDAVTHPPLRCCIRDTIGLYVVLTHPAYGAFAPEHVTVLLDGTDAEVRLAVHTVIQQLAQEHGVSARPGMVEEIIEKRLLPEREEIVAALQAAAHTSTAEDLLVFSFAGHGHTADGALYLLPPRTRPPLYFWTAVRLDEVKDILHQSRARETVFFLNASFSGLETESSVTTPNEKLGEALFVNTDDLAFLTSCLPGEQCFAPTDDDEPAGRPVYSLFTSFLLAGLMGQADPESKGCVTLADLAQYVTDKMNTWGAAHVTPEKGGVQTPRLRATHAERIILSGDRSVARQEVIQEDRRAPASMAVRPLAVRVWIQPAEAPLRSTVHGDAPQPRLAEPMFTVGQAVLIAYSVNRDAYLYLLSVDAEGKAVLTFPSDDWQENHVRGNRPWFLLSQADDAGPPLPVPGPPGRVTLIAIATVQPAPILTEWQQAGQDAIAAPNLARLAQALVRVPRGQWAVGQFQFVVREARG